MKHRLSTVSTVFIAAGVASAALLALAACTDTKRAQMERQFTDKPSTIRCLSYGQPLYVGRSKGKAEIDETGKLAFTDAATNQLTTVEGDCVVVSDR